MHLYYGVLAHQPNKKFETWSAIWSAYIGYGRYFSLRSSNVTADVTDSNTLDHGFGILAILIIFFRQLFTFMMEGFLFTLCIVLWIPVKRFSDLVICYVEREILGERQSGKLHIKCHNFSQLFIKSIYESNIYFEQESVY